MLFIFKTYNSYRIWDQIHVKHCSIKNYLNVYLTRSLYKDEHWKVFLKQLFKYRCPHIFMYNSNKIVFRNCLNLRTAIFLYRNTIYWPGPCFKNKFNMILINVSDKCGLWFFDISYSNQIKINNTISSILWDSTIK